MKIFGIGLSRTGTASLAAALRLLGRSCVHCPTSEDQIAENDAATDIPIAAEFIALDRQYAGAKFIYTHRDVDAWLASCRKLFGSRPIASLREEYRGFFRDLRMRLYGVTEFDEAAFRSAFARHEQAVVRHFEGRDEALLWLEICGGEGWEVLCPFLGAHVPSVPFPHENTAARASAPRAARA